MNRDLNNKSTRVLERYFLEKNKNSTVDELSSIIEYGYGEYLGRVFLKEWELLKLKDIISSLETEHGKSLGALFENEIQRIQLKDLNDKLERSSLIREMDLKMASNVQKSLVFQNPPQVGNFDIAFYYNPFDMVSGDFFDFYIRNDILEGITLADVSGHGIASGLLTALAKPIFFNRFRHNSTIPLGDILTKVNYSLIKEIDESYYYLTAVMLRFHDDIVEYASAAHPEMIHYHADSGKTEVLNLDTHDLHGCMLGISAVIADINTYKFPVKKNDSLIIYTDCLTESLNSEGIPFEHEGILKAMEKAKPSHTAGEITDIILSEFHGFVDKSRIKDDLTFIVLKKL